MVCIVYKFFLRLSNVSNEGLLGHSGGGSGGYLEHTLKYAAQQLYGIEIQNLQFKTLRYNMRILQYLRFGVNRTVINIILP